MHIDKRLCIIFPHHGRPKTNSDKHNNLFAHAQLQNSVNKALNTIRNITSTLKETNWWSFDESLAGCLENVINL